MVNGIEIFKERFAGLEGQYVLIGGTACDLLYGQQGLDFRATKDFDIVLCVEALEPGAGFMKRFWDFVAEGKYKAQQHGSERRLYRFIEPQDPRFPTMLELFSRAPLSIEVAEGTRLVPIPGDEEVSSLSAILLNDASYRFLVKGTTMVDGVRLASAERLIALKAHAWQDFSLRTAEEGSGRKATKHRKDIYRLGRLLVPSSKVQLPEGMKPYLKAWLEAEIAGAPLDPKDPALGGLSAAEICGNIQTVFFEA